MQRVRDNFFYYAASYTKHFHYITLHLQCYVRYIVFYID